MSDVKLVLTGHQTTTDGDKVTLHKPGDKISVDESTARTLVRAGVAIPATVTAAKKIDADPDEAS